MGRYRIRRRIGRGGMAEVFEAVAEGDGGFSRRVALKRCLPGEADTPAFQQMFMEEARVASGLHHPNVVAIWDCGVADGQPFQVMELVEGLDSEALLLGQGDEALARSMPPAQALYLAAEVARGLAHVHAACGEDGRPLGLVHRDVSPSNVLVSWAGEVKLADFGIVYARQRLHRTEAGTTKGKAEFMSPEQATAGELDGRSDVFGLACTLHTWLTGYSPLGRDPGMVGLLAGASLSLDPSLGAEETRLLRRALQRDRAERHMDAGALARELDAILRGHGVSDPAGALRAWLESRRPDSATGLAEGLGDLFSLDLLAPPEATSHEQGPTASSGARVSLPAVRRFTRAGREAVSASAVRSQARPGVAWWLGALFMSASLLGLGWWFFSLPATPSAAPVANPGVSGTVPVESGSAGVLGNAQEQASPADLAAASETAELPSLRREAGVPSVSRSSGPAPRARRDRGGKPTEPGVEAGARGTVLVSGPGALRARILVDGRPRGFAPRKFELAAGRHRLELVTPDGRRLRRRLRVTSRHTDSTPLRVIIGAAAD